MVEFDAAFVARMGSALLWVLAGLALVFVGRTRESRWLGVFALGFGLPFLLNNFYDEEPAYVLLIDAPFARTAQAAAAFALLWIWGRHDRRTARWTFALAGAIIMLGLVSYAGTRIENGSAGLAAWGAERGLGGAPLPLLLVLQLPGALSPQTVVALAATLRFVLALPHARQARWAALAVATGIYVLYVNGTVLLFAQPSQLGDALALVWLAFVLATCAVLWLVAAERGGGVVALLGLFAMLGAFVVGVAMPTVAGVPQELVGRDPTGLRGVFRTVGWAALVYAILRHDLLGIGLRPRTVDRGTLLAAALALVFVVAEVAQNFLSAQYGLVMGGVVAGTLLFAAAPIQRAVERRHAPGAAPAQAPRENEEAYRRALRIALRDRVVTHDEEIHLADLGERLGIRAGRARELRHDVERELQEAR